MTIVLYGIKGVERKPIREEFPYGNNLQEFLKKNSDVTVIRLEEIPPYAKLGPRPTLYMGGDEDLEDRKPR